MDETLSLCVNFLVYKASEPLAPKVAMSPRDAQRDSQQANCIALMSESRFIILSVCLQLLVRGSKTER